jgi:hypothetical protein
LKTALSGDTWGRPLAYRGDREGFTLASNGPDGEDGTGDDIVMIDGRFAAEPGPGGR